MATTTPPRVRQARESVVIRFAGDSGDGMQVTGSRFTVEAALAGNDLTTFPDFPAEIRAPAGTTYGVSAFQIQDRKSTRLNSSHLVISYAVFCLKKKKKNNAWKWADISTGL